MNVGEMKKGVAKQSFAHGATIVRNPWRILVEDRIRGLDHRIGCGPTYLEKWLNAFLMALYLTD